MDRRFLFLVGLVLAAAGSGDRRVLAQAPVPSPADNAPAPPPPPPPPLPAPAELQGGALPPAAELPPVAAMPVPEGLTTPAPVEPRASGPAPDAPRDLQFERAQAPPLGARPAAKGAGLDRGPLPAATETPGQASPSATIEADPFVLPPERLPLGRQAVGLSVEVVGPQVLNLNQQAALRIIVRNTGTSDAMGVVVRDELPESLAFQSSQPEAEHSDRLLFWRLNTVPAGTERTILLRVKTIKVGELNHAATVTMLAGSKSRTIVREPKLKVELTASPGKVQKGQQVQWKIAISNPGDGPARNVVIQAKLSPGLRHDSGEPNDQNLFEQTLDQIEPGQRIVLDALVADTVAAGEQTCLVEARSNDVTTSGDDGRTQASVTVIEPKLQIAIVGDEKRFTDTIASYQVTVANPGTATTHNVRVLVVLPLSGRLVGPPPTGARWDQSNGKLLWTIPQVEPGDKEKVTLKFQVRMGGIGIYAVSVESRADGGLSAKDSFRTDVSGLVDFEFEVEELRNVVDVDDTNQFKIRIKNVGTKEATNLLVRALLTNNIEPSATSGNDRMEAKYNPDQHLLVFPPIDRLGPGKEIVLGIKVKAKDKGLARCHVSLVHDELTPDEALEDMAAFKVTVPRQ